MRKDKLKAKRKKMFRMIMALITAPRPEPDYRCTQPELYSGLTTVWSSYETHEAAFMAENTKWTAGLAATRKAAIDAAKALPDGQARYADSESMRVDMVVLQEECLEKWNSLDGYIKNAFPGNYYKPRIEEAGKNYYETAANADWEDLAELMQAGNNFITLHNAALLADGGMPPTFAAAFADKKTAFDTKYDAYKTARKDAQEQTDAKIIANNAIYADGLKVMEDGKHIFRKNATVRGRFTWDTVLSMITPGGGGTATVVREGDVAIGEILDIVTNNFEPTEDTMVTVEVSGAAINLSAAPSPGPSMGPITWNVSIGTVTKTIAEFVALVGSDETNAFLKVQGFGPAVAHYKITFTKVDE